MGLSASQVPPQEHADQTMALLRNKRDEFLAKIESKRGHTSHFEVMGGRSVMRHSEIRLKHAGQSTEGALTGALNDFFAAVSGSSVKQQSIASGLKMLRSGLDSLFMTGENCLEEKEGWFCAYINSAFCRIDFCVAVFASKGSFNDPGSEAGSCYVADISVLDPGDLSSSEMDYFLTQSLGGNSGRSQDSAATTVAKAQGDIELVGRMKILLVQSALCSKLLKRPNVSFKEMQEITDAMSMSMQQVKTLYDQLADHVPEHADTAAAAVATSKSTANTAAVTKSK